MTGKQAPPSASGAMFLVLCTILWLEGISGQVSIVLNNSTAPYESEPMLITKGSGSLVFTVRIMGPDIIPLTTAKQSIIMRSLQPTIGARLGPSVLRDYQEGFAIEDNATTPFVDMDVQIYDQMPRALNANSSAAADYAQNAFTSFVAWVLGMRAQGLNVTVRIATIQNPPLAVVAPQNYTIITRTVRLVKSLMTICVEGGDQEAYDAINSAVYLLRQQLVYKYTHSVMAINDTALPASVCAVNGSTVGSPNVAARQLVVRGAVGICAEDHFDDLYWCWKDALGAVQGQVGTAGTWLVQELQQEGLPVLSIVNITTIMLPQRNMTEVQNGMRGTVNTPRTWPLQRLGQRSTLTDAQLKNPPPVLNEPTGGTGVNVYLLSSGVRASHQEFRRADGTSKILPGWGYQGQNPLMDCNDNATWFGLGTYAASMIAGNTLGVAPNATVYSVKFRTGCVIDGTDIWRPGGLPSAIDAVLSNFRAPGIMVIDTWWSKGRFLDDDDAYLEAALQTRLDAAQRMGIPVLAQAGGSYLINVCDNIFANRSNTIVVSSTNLRDVRSAGAPYNSPCIDMWAPGGDSGNGILGASAAGDDKYIDVIPLDAGALWLTAGLAARMLSSAPQMTPEQLKRALQTSGTPGLLIDIGDGDLGGGIGYTNFSVAAVGGSGLNGSVSGVSGGTGNTTSSSSGSSSDGGLSGGAIAGIVVGVVVAMVVVVAAVALYVARRRRGGGGGSVGAGGVGKGGSGGGGSGGRWELANSNTNQHIHSIGTSHPSYFKPLTGTASNLSSALLDSKDMGLEQDWLLKHEDIVFETRENGALVELGKGQFGKVVKARKNGVQDVAVKLIERSADGAREREFAREVEMMRACSLDPNIVPFYGVVLTQEHMGLVAEYMQGGDLRHALTNHPEHVCWSNLGKQVALDVARGLVFMHSKNIVHRDIKSKNILLTGEGRAKIGDVGLATMAQKEGYFTNASALGTFAWAAPEIFRASRCGAAVDIYSFGVVLWEIATREVPVRGRLYDPPQSADCPAELLDIIHACTQEEPRARPTARQLYELLRHTPHQQDGPWPADNTNAPPLAEASSSTLSPAWPSSGQSCIYYDSDGQPHICYVEPGSGAYVDLYTGEVLPPHVPVYREVAQDHNGDASMPLQPSISAENYVQQMYDRNGVPLYANGNTVYEEDDSAPQYYTDGVSLYSGGHPGYPGGAQPPAGALVPMQDEAGNVYLTEVTYTPVVGGSGSVELNHVHDGVATGDGEQQGVGAPVYHHNTGDAAEEGPAKAPPSANGYSGGHSGANGHAGGNTAVLDTRLPPVSTSPLSNNSTEEISVTVSSIQQRGGLSGMGTPQVSSGEEDNLAAACDQAMHDKWPVVPNGNGTSVATKDAQVLNGAPALPVPPPRGD